MNKLILLTLMFISLGLKPIETNIKLVEKSLIGFWIQNPSLNENAHFLKKNKFKKDKFGFNFLKDSIVIIRTSNSMCGTPPITYENLKGKWYVIDNKILKLEFEPWYGKTVQKWEIINLSKKEIELKYINTINSK